MPISTEAGRTKATAPQWNPRYDGRFAAARLVLGLVLMLAAAAMEMQWLAMEPFAASLIAAESAPGVEGGIPVSVQTLPANLSAREMALLERAFTAATEGDGQLTAAMKDILDGPRVVFADLDADTLAALTISGRPPAPGAREALAGDLASGANFDLNGETWTVTGRLPQGAAAFLYSYLIPAPPVTDDEFAVPGVLYLDAAEAIDLWLEAGTAAEDTAPLTAVGEDTGLVRGIARSPLYIAWMTWAALILIAWGGIPIYLQGIRKLLAIAPPMPRILLTEMRRWPRLFLAMHLFLFGAFFLAMSQGILQPLWNLRVLSMVSAVFTQGDLQYVSEAYASGDIPAAAWATFQNNYIVQTFGMTFFFSIMMGSLGALPPLLAALLVPLPLGVGKTLASFWIVGYGMSPCWVGAAAGYSYHSITMVLELEAYVVACFVVLVWPLRLLQGLRSKDVQVITGAAHLLASGLLVTAGMLALAALYEALTLILLAG